MSAEENFFPKKLNLDFDPFFRHFDRYHTIIKFLGKIGKEEVWLDCASGSGYGTSILSNYTKKIYGYDISKSAVEYANKNYKSSNCIFINSLEKVKKCNVIFSIETIEHMSKEEGIKFLNNLHNKLTDDGQFLITTPIVKKTNLSPKNIYHALEYSNKDFINLLNLCNFSVKESFFVETTFTDGETKDQGYYKCVKT